jgi:hypothetical protein
MMEKKIQCTGDAGPNTKLREPWDWDHRSHRKADGIHAGCEQHPWPSLLEDPAHDLVGLRLILVGRLTEDHLKDDIIEVPC